MALKLPGAEDLGGRPSARAGRPIASYDTSAIGRGAAQLGSGIMSMAADLRQMDVNKKAKVDQATAFATKRRAMEFAATQEKALVEAGQAAEPGAFGFKETYQQSYIDAAKEFYQSVPEDLKPQYDVELFDIENKLATQAQTFEKAQRSSYYKAEVDTGLTRIESDLYANPDSFEESVWKGEQFIDALPDEDIGPIEKEAMRRGWKAKAQLAALSGMKPAERLRALGEAPGGDDIINAMIGVESGGDPSAESPVGALGLMQVMPGTAAEIAAEIGDSGFPRSPEAQEAYLKDPDVSVKYGSFYYQKMLARYDGDVEAALVAYNGGPARADAWLRSGRNDSVIPQESADYYKKVMGRAGKQASGEADGNANAFLKTRLVGHGDDHIDGMRPEMQTRLAAMFNSAPPGIREKLGIFSGARSVDRQAELWAAALKKYGSPEAARKWVAPPGKSAHNHGSAADLSYDGKSLAHAPKEVVAWVHANAGKHGLKFPLGNENWHVELEETRGGKGYRVDPRFADIDYASREVIAAKAQKEADDIAATTALESKAAYLAHDQRVGLDIELGNIATENQLLDDPLLDDGDLTKHIKAYRAKTKEEADVKELVAAIVVGDRAAGAVNGFDVDERKKGDKAYEAILKASGPENAEVVTQAFVAGTGYVPKDVQSALRQGALASDPAVFASAMSRADALEVLAPISFGSFEGGSDVREKLGLFRHFVNDRQMSGEAAAERIIRMKDPAQKVNREILKPEADKFVKTLTVDQVTAEFDPGIFGAEPGAGVMPVQVNGLLAEYREIAEEKFYEAGGDTGAAKALALTELKTRWNVSNVSGKPNLMRLPPEIHYPAIDGGHEYLRTDALKTAESYVADTFPGRKVENVAIVSDKATRADIEMGRPPRYRLFYQYQENGQTRFDEVFEGLWGMDGKELKTLGSTAQENARNRFLQTRTRNDTANQVERDAAVEAERALDETVGPDWMKANAAAAARERGRMDADTVRAGVPVVEPAAPEPIDPATLPDTPGMARKRTIDRAVWGSSEPKL
jgi:hypothetical protein